MAMEIFKLMGTVAINKDKALQDIKAIQEQAKRASTEMGGSFTKFSGYVEEHSAQIKKAGKMMMIFGGIATAVFAVAVKGAADLETQLANVSTMLDESAMKILPEYRRGLQALSVEFGESTQTLSKGLYDILSASIPPAEALNVLEISAKAAAAGITDTGVAADAITTILNSYGMSADQAGMVSDKLFAIVKEGKCLTGDTRILLSDGRYRRIDSLRNEKDLEIVSWDYRNFIPMKAKFVDMGTKQTVKILTGMGREIKTTPEHPYLTPDGWIKVEDLKKGDRIAIPSSLPFFGNIKPRDGWPELLGYLLAEGSIQRGTPRLTIADNRILIKVRDVASRYGINLKKINQSDKTKCNSYMLTAGTRDKHHKNPVIEKLREYKLWGTNCHTKFIPDEIFSWERDDIAKLLNAYFNGDGWLAFDSNNSGRRELGICSVSKRLLEDVSHLLLRFGINGCVRKNSKNAWVWTTRRYIEIKRFLDYIGIERDSVKRFLEYIPKGRGSYAYLTSYGKIPRKKRKYKPYNGLRNTDNQLYYDKIKEIIYEEEERVYDLIVSKLHNFVANDILAHNTTFAELAPSIGKVAATASMSGLSFDDLGASIATMTRAGIRTEEAMTAINGVLNAFLKPTDEAIEAAKGFGLVLDTNTLRSEGMTGVMEKLTKATAEQLAQVFPNIRGLKGMAAALGDAEGYARSYALMLNSAGLTQEAFTKQSDTLNFKLNQLKEMFNVIKVTIGTVLMPVVEDITEKVMGALVKVKEWTEANKPLTESLVKWGAGVSGTTLVLGALVMMLPGFVKNLVTIAGWIGPLSANFTAFALSLGMSAPALALAIIGFAKLGWEIGKAWKEVREAPSWKEIGEMGVQAADAQVKALEKLQKAYGLTEEEMGKVAKNMEEGKGLLEGIRGPTEEVVEATKSLQETYNLTNEEMDYWLENHKMAPSALQKVKEATYALAESEKELAEATKESTKSFEELDGAVLNSIITGKELSEGQEEYMGVRQRMSDLDRTATQQKIDDLDRECVALLTNMDTNLMTMEQIDEYRQVMLDHIVTESSEREEYLRNMEEIQNRIFELTHTRTEVELKDLDFKTNAYVEAAKRAMLSAEEQEEAMVKIQEAYDKEKASILELAIARSEGEIASLEKAIELRKESGEAIDELIKKRNAEVANLNGLKEAYSGTAAAAEKLATAEAKHKPPELVGAAVAGQFKVLNPQGGYEGVTSDPNALTAAEVAAGWSLVPLAQMAKGGLIKSFIESLKYLAAGGGIGTDTVPIMATPGEYLIKKQMVDFIRRTGMVTGGLVEAIRRGLPTPNPEFAGGGMVGRWTGSQLGVAPVGGGVWGGGITFGKESIVINAKTLDDATINQAGDQIMRVVHEKAKNAGLKWGTS